MQRRIDLDAIKADDFETAKASYKPIVSALKQILGTFKLYGKRAKDVRSQHYADLRNQVQEADQALGDESKFDAGVALGKLKAVAGTLNTVETELEAVANQLVGPDVDFGEQEQARTRLQELDRRFDQLQEMRTGPVVVESLQEASETMTTAKNAAHTAADAGEYSAVAAKNATLGYVLAMDTFQREAESELPGAISGSMKVGTEFTFTKDEIHELDTERNDLIYKAAAKLVSTWEELVLAKKDFKPAVTHEALDGGAAEEDQKAPKFTYQLPSGATWWWRLDIDYGCLETQAQPTTANQASGTWEGDNDNSVIKGIIASHIFGLAAEVGVAPHEEIGGGHLSLDRATTFGDNSRFLRNFLVLYVNERGDWAQEDPDEINAPMITDLKSAGKAKFKQVIKAYDDDFAEGNAWTVADLSNELKSKVFIGGHFAGDEPAKRKEQPAHYQATNLEHMTAEDQDARRIEMRRFDAQTSLDDLLEDMAKLTGLVARSRAPGLVELNL